MMTWPTVGGACLTSGLLVLAFWGSGCPGTMRVFVGDEDAPIDDDDTADDDTADDDSVEGDDDTATVSPYTGTYEGQFMYTDGALGPPSLASPCCVGEAEGTVDSTGEVHLAGLCRCAGIWMRHVFDGEIDELGSFEGVASTAVGRGPTSVIGIAEDNRIVVHWEYEFTRNVMAEAMFAVERVGE